MATTNILVPLDGSDATFRCMEAGLRRIGGPANVTLLVVMDAKLLSMPEEAREHLEWDDEDELFLREDEVKDVLKRGETIARKAVKDAKVFTKIVKGDVLADVVKESSKHDVLVMHRLRREEATDERRRSLTESIARSAACDVLLVHDDEYY